jgi:hypothetical protein
MGLGRVYHSRFGTLSTLGVGRGTDLQLVEFIRAAGKSQGPHGSNQIFKTLTTINRQGVTILMFEENAMALAICQPGYVLETRTIILEGRVEGSGPE